MSEELLKEQEAKIEALNNEIAAMKAQAEESKSAAAIKEAVAAAQTKPAPTPNPVVQKLQRDRVIASVGGMAHYASLPISSRLAANGHAPASESECETARKLFGPNSSSLEATRLQRQNPNQYSRLRAVYRELALS